MHLIETGGIAWKMADERKQKSFAMMERNIERLQLEEPNMFVKQFEHFCS